MTFVSDDDDGVVPELKLRMEDSNRNGDYVKLNGSEAEGGNGGGGGRDEGSSSCWKRGSFCWWVKSVILFILFGALAAVVVKWIGPFFIDKVLVILLPLVVVFVMIFISYSLCTFFLNCESDNVKMEIEALKWVMNITIVMLLLKQLDIL